MRILFDHNVPSPLIAHLQAHTVTTAKRAGWDRASDRELLKNAEAEGFELFLTGDRRILSQQNPKHRKIAVLVLITTRWPMVQRYVRRVAAAVDAALPGSHSEIEIPCR
jgi:predicted nuclease of predicted toxin-antitoxin system